jgi:hypothetical protein
MHCWLKRWQLVQRPSFEFSKPEHRIYDPVSKPSSRLWSPISNVPCVVGSIGRQLLFSVAGPRPGRRPEVVEVVRRDRGDIPCREALERERQSCWTVGEIVKTPGGSVEAAGIAMVAADSKRGRTREGRKTADTVEAYQKLFTTFYQNKQGRKHTE